MAHTIKRSDTQKAAEAEIESFRKHLGPFVVAAETTRMPMVFTDPKGKGNPIVFANNSFLSLTGYGRDEVLGQSFNSLMARGTDAAELARITATFEGNTSAESEVHYRRKDDTEFWATLYSNPVQDEHGEVVQYFASFVDLTKHRREQVKNRKLIDEREFTD